MPYYAVGFGSWSAYGYRHATEQEIAAWKQENPDKEEPKEFLVRNACYDGSSAKAAGPFITAEQAWNAASELQRGASMMADIPFVFYSGQKLKLSTIINKIDSGEYEVKEEYAGKHNVHKLRFVREYQNYLSFYDINNTCQEFYVRGGKTPSARLARCRIINRERKRRSAGLR